MVLGHLFHWNYRHLTNVTKRFTNCVADKFYIFKRGMNSKPPNILVFTGNNSKKLFKNIEDNILQCLQTDSYLVYHLLSTEVTKQPWMENTLLLVVSCDEIDDSVAAVFSTYVSNSGKMLLSSSKFNINLLGNECVSTAGDKDNLIQVCFKDVEELYVYRGNYSYKASDSTALCFDSSNKSVLHRTKTDKSILIASEIYLDRDLENCVSQKYNREKRLLLLKYVLVQEFGLKAKNEECSVPQLSPGYLISNKKSKIIGHINRLKLNVYSDKPFFRECTVMSSGVQTKLPVYFLDDSVKLLTFDKNLYFSNLNTDLFGHNLVYFSVITSTMDVVQHMSDCSGIVIVAGCQINGKGRGGNKWISPMGCASFTLYINLPLFSNLGQKLSVIQHIAALAVVHGIRKQDQYREINLKIKWPNDIYCDTCKIGGLIVSSTIQSNVAQVSIGWGINVANDRPTSCINNSIDKYNSENSRNLPYLHVEEVIAYTVSQMEYFIKSYERSESENILSLYYSYWMHSNQQVTLVDLNEQGTITGIDEYGFLTVRTGKEKTLSLQPDGNRFDIMKNLIYSKK